jgi:biopolymer transport protein TolQ
MKFFLLFAATPGVYYAYENSDTVGKAVVLLLIFGSILTWTTMVDKWMSLHRAGKLSGRFLSRFRENDRNIATASLVRSGREDASPIAAIYCAGVSKLLEFYQQSQSQSGIYQANNTVVPCRLSDAQYNAIEAVLEQEISTQIQELETKIGLLATLVSLSPFCGLFGTVWGVMMAFCGIAIAGKPDFAALAPGIAGALLTTVAGLIVAIPSLVGYNYLNATIRNLTVSMDNFAEEFMVKIKLEQLEFDRHKQDQ